VLRLLGILVSVLFAIGAAVLTWPQFFRLERTFPIAQIVSLRGALALGFVALALLALLLCLSRRMRGFAATILVVSLVASAANAGIMLARGVGNAGLGAKTEAAVRIMTWNTAGAEADLIARTAVAMQADIVALPETTIETGTAVAVAMREMGRPMWAHHESFADRAGYEGWAANSTTLLISPDLGDYAVVQSDADGTTNTSTVPTVVAMPVDGTGPVVVAVHAVAPRPGAMAAWRGDLQWLADQCATDSVIMAGDFNATVDHMAQLGTGGGDLGRCLDATSASGNGAVGTWSSRWPPLLGAPIDHVMSTPAWRATGSTVVGSLDDAGSDHRPLVVQLEPAG
jgi:endonuclease/exonuclease/phosphatase (EEP) superfamily protein YafD